MYINSILGTFIFATSYHPTSVNTYFEGFYMTTRTSTQVAVPVWHHWLFSSSILIPSFVHLDFNSFYFHIHFSFCVQPLPRNVVVVARSLLSSSPAAFLAHIGVVALLLSLYRLCLYALRRILMYLLYETI